MEIEEWFCTPIATFQTDSFDLLDYCLKVKDKCPPTQIGWIHQPYHTKDIVGHNTANDSNFIDLHQWVHDCVDQFSAECGYDKMILQDVWFNVYEKGDSQEFHTHPGSSFSCVYFAEAREDDPRIIFQRQPWLMHPNRVITPNRYNWQQIWYKPLTGILLIFNSETAHMVEKKVTDTPRITFSYNFTTTIPNDI